MINAVVYSRTSTVKLVQIPHPRLSYKGTFTSEGISETFVDSVNLIVRKIIKILRPNYQFEKERKWVIVRVHSAGVNPVDAKFLYGDKIPNFLIYFLRFFIEKRVCGIDFSGEISDAPLDCDYRVGDQVFGTMAYPKSGGSFAEFVRASTDSICLKPRTLTHAEASALPLVGLTAVQAFDDNNLRAGMHVLIFGGSGGTGHMAVQVAKIRGMKVTAVCSSHNAAFVKSLGADKVISYDKADNLIAELTQAAGEMGLFNMVFDTVSTNDARDALYRYEQTVMFAQYPLMVPEAEGKYVRLGGTPSDWFIAHVKRYFRLDFFPVYRELFWVRLNKTSNNLQQLREYCDTSGLRPIVTKHLPFTQKGVRQALVYQLSRRTVGKMVIDVVPSESSEETKSPMGHHE